uniref:Uncharacterized protein n=1 Tax=Ascaris lumbricoides TaxID=6252 RepID=A0A0M3ITE3_ASCLU
MWTKKTVWVSYALTFIAPFVYSHRWLSRSCRFFIFGEGVAMSYVDRPEIREREKLRDASIMFFGVAFFEVIVNVASFIIYRRSCKTTRFSRIERNLFVVTLGMFGATILMALFLVSFTFFFSTSLHGYKKRE